MKNPVGKKFPIGNAYSYPLKKDYSYLCMWKTSNWLERNKILIRCGKYSTQKSIWENQYLSWITCSWAALKDNVKQAKILWTQPGLCHTRHKTLTGWLTNSSCFAQALSTPTHLPSVCQTIMKAMSPAITVRLVCVVAATDQLQPT